MRSEYIKQYAEKIVDTGNPDVDEVLTDLQMEADLRKYNWTD